MHFESAPMIALLEAKAAGLWSRMHSPGSLPRGVGSRLPASFALKRDLLALRFDGKMPRLRR
jgi:hypothetical protein